MKKFDVITMFATYPKCYLYRDTYAANNHIYLAVWSEEEGPISNITVNVDGINAYPTNYGCVDMNNFPEAEALITKLKIGKPTGRCIWSGMCMYPIYEFNMERINIMLGQKVYIVEFEIQKNRTTYFYNYYTLAANAKDACAIAKQNWEGKEHMFHIHAVKSTIQDSDLLSVKSWKSKQYTGKDSMDRFVCTDYRKWN